MKTTLISHFYNEEYLLPWWIIHHKRLFDNVILIDYGSTDTSREIISSMAPEWTVINSRNSFFGAEEIDSEVEDIENSIDGWTICLNTTEFLLCYDSPNHLLKDGLVAYGIPQYSVLNFEHRNNPSTYSEFYKGLFFGSLSDGYGHRFIHKIKGQKRYQPGRHGLNYYPTMLNPDMHIAHCRFYPWNEKFIQRKLQIAQRIPQKDIDRKFGFQHMWNLDQMELEKNKLMINRKNLLKEHSNFRSYLEFNLKRMDDK